MIESGSKQPLLMQLLQERRRFVEQVVEMYAEKGVTAGLLRECEAEEMRRRMAGMRAIPLPKVLAKRGVLTEKEVEAAMRRRAKSDPFLAQKDLESMREASRSPGQRWRRSSSSSSSPTPTKSPAPMPNTCIYRWPG